MEQQFQTVLAEHRRRYPAMEPQDYGKLAYQSEFGPEHMITQPELVADRLRMEWQAVNPIAMQAQAVEPIGNGLCRFHLTACHQMDEAIPLLADLFCHTAQEHRGTDAGLQRKLDLLADLPVAGMDQWLNDYRQQGCPAVHHSDGYRAAYAPHYRVLSAEYGYYFPVLLEVHRLLQRGQRLLIAIDGRCGSGKTRLADLIQKLFPCHVFHLDDFYLPMEQRGADWEHQIAGNMDLDRFRREVLLPVRDGRAVEYGRYRCQEGRYLEPTVLEPCLLNVVEGSYCQHPKLSDLYDWKLFLTCEAEEQLARIQQREGAYSAMFQSRWIPMEERYLRQHHIEEQAQLVLDTSHFFATEA